MNIYAKTSIGIAAGAAVVGLWLVFSAGSAQALTDRNNYEAGDLLKIEIRNNSGKPICFSGCYPYLLESQAPDKRWQTYEYGPCEMEDVVAACVGAGKSKKFQLPLDETEGGTHRIKIPVCVNCAASKDFKGNSELYSNVFQIK